jgi:hypothetical protein
MRSRAFASTFAPGLDKRVSHSGDGDDVFIERYLLGELSSGDAAPKTFARGLNSG